MPKKRRKSKKIIPYRLKKRIAGFLVLLVLGAFGGYYLPGKVMRVHDGDTVTVLTKEGKMQKIRLYGIDCPESRQKGGSAATTFTEEFALMQDVDITPVSVDHYGRSVAIITMKNGSILNEELVKAGHAWVYRQYCDRPECLRWLTKEADARRKKIGLWEERNPVAPWNWRRNK